MNLAAWFFLYMLSVSALFGSIPAIGMNYDRIAVWLMRRLHIFAYPNAIRLAVSLERDMHEWTLDEYEAKHPTIGRVRYYDSPGILKVELDGIVWKPNAIERRIISNAAKAVFARCVNSHFDKVLPA